MLAHFVKNEKKDRVKMEAIVLKKNGEQKLVTKEITAQEQKKLGVMYSDFILSFDCYVEELEGSQAFITFYLPVLENEEKQLKLMMRQVDSFCDYFNLPKSKLFKISTACNWDLFTELTGDKAAHIHAVNGKFYFGNRSDLDDFEEATMDGFGFGTAFYFDVEAA